MPDELTRKDYDYILSCLDYARVAYESTQYPTNELRDAQLSRLAALQRKLRKILGQNHIAT